MIIVICSSVHLTNSDNHNLNSHEYHVREGKVKSISDLYSNQLVNNKTPNQ